jgi:hypothetical protein
MPASLPSLNASRLQGYLHCEPWQHFIRRDLNPGFAKTYPRRYPPVLSPRGTPVRPPCHAPSPQPAGSGEHSFL